MVLVTLAMPVASAADWQQFQKDEISIGWTTDTGPVIKPQLAWSHNIGSDGHAGIEGTPIVGGGKVFVLNHTGWLHAFYAKTGEPAWDPVFCNLDRKSQLNGLFSTHIKRLLHRGFSGFVNNSSTRPKIGITNGETKNCMDAVPT